MKHKVVLVGNGSVGKTSIILRLQNGTFTNTTDPTINLTEKGTYRITGYAIDTGGNETTKKSGEYEIYEGINEGKSLVIDKIDDQLIIKIANSTNRFVINITSGSLGAYANIDSELISDKIQLKGVLGIYGIRYLKPINLQKQVGYQMTVMKNYLEFINPFNGHIKMNMGIALEFGGKLLPTAVSGLKSGTAGGIVAGLYVAYASNSTFPSGYCFCSACSSPACTPTLYNPVFVVFIITSVPFSSYVKSFILPKP